jgi:coenzyme F420-0:L-glutamate ligase / coenzyme F420-1:gamma-L-glutamate ligase
VTQIAVADQLCAAATLVSGEAAEGQPVVIARGVPRDYLTTSRGADALVRPLEQDLFR